MAQTEPTDDEIREFIEAWNGDEVGADSPYDASNPDDFEQARHVLRMEDKYYYARKERGANGD